MWSHLGPNSTHRPFLTFSYFYFDFLFYSLSRTTQVVLLRKGPCDKSHPSSNLHLTILIRLYLLLLSVMTRHFVLCLNDQVRKIRNRERIILEIMFTLRLRGNRNEMTVCHLWPNDKRPPLNREKIQFRLN